MKLTIIYNVLVAIVLHIHSVPLALGDAEAYATRLGDHPVGSIFRNGRSVGKGGESGNMDGNTNQNAKAQLAKRSTSSGQTENSADTEDWDDNEVDELGQSLHKINILVRKKKEALDRYIRDDNSGAGALRRLMSESTQLANEVGDSFKLFAKREVEMTNDMAELNRALNEAVQLLKKSIEQENKELTKAELEVHVRDKETLDRQKRNALNYGRANQYKACVSLEPMHLLKPPEIGHGKKKFLGPDPLPNIHEFMPPESNRPQFDNSFQQPPRQDQKQLQRQQEPIVNDDKFVPQNAEPAGSIPPGLLGPGQQQWMNSYGSSVNFLHEHPGLPRKAIPMYPLPEDQPLPPPQPVVEENQRTPPNQNQQNRPFPAPPDQQGRPFPSPPDQQGRPFPSPPDQQAGPFPSPPNQQGRPFPSPPDQQDRPFPGPPDQQGRPFPGPPDQQDRPFPGPPDQQGRPFPGPPDQQGGPFPSPPNQQGQQGRPFPGPPNGQNVPTNSMPFKDNIRPFPGPPNQENVPAKVSSFRQNIPPSNRSGSPGNDMDVDLNEVYWLRLDPKRKQEMLHKRLDSLLVEKQKIGKDILVIPIAHKFRNKEQVKETFLHAVRTRPLGQKAKREQLRRARSIQIMEL